MNCHRIKRCGRPASWLHSRFCAECRESQRADDLLAFGIVQLRTPIHTHTPLNATLAALNLRSLPENYARIRRQRRRAQAHRAMAATAALSVCGWFTYMNWTPAEPHVYNTHQDTSGYTAFALANGVLTSDANNISVDVNHLAQNASVAQAESSVSPPLHTSNRIALGAVLAPMTEASNVGSFVRTNGRALALIHANLTTPYHETIPRTVQETLQQPSRLNKLMITLRADAEWKRYQRDDRGALAEAMNLMTFGENVSGGGSLMARYSGEASQ
jgi:hypothetical protein